MATRNQTEGHRWERQIVQVLRNSGLYPNAVTCRSTNRTRDGQGVDVCNKEESIDGRMQDDIQAKTTVATPDLASLLHAMKEHDLLDERIPVVFWRKTGKSEQGKFMEKGKFAVCFMEDYIRLLRMREFYKVIAPLLPILMTHLQKEGRNLRYLEVYNRLKELDLIPEK